MATVADSGNSIWEFRSDDGRYAVDVYERADGILVFRSRGVCLNEGALRLLKFLFDHSRSTKRPLRVICDNSQLDHIDRGARKTMASFADEASPIERLATFGDNFFMRSFTNLYAAISRTEIKSVVDEQQALAWIKSGEVER